MVCCRLYKFYTVLWIAIVLKPDPDPRALAVDSDPEPAKSRGSDLIRIHNTASMLNFILIVEVLIAFA
jgi:hypothetical protein